MWKTASAIISMVLALFLIVAIAVYSGYKMAGETVTPIEAREQCPAPKTDGKIINRQAFENDLMKAVKDVVGKHTDNVDLLRIKTGTDEVAGKDGCIFLNKERSEEVTFTLTFKVKR